MDAMRTTMTTNPFLPRPLQFKDLPYRYSIILLFVVDRIFTNFHILFFFLIGPLNPAIHGIRVASVIAFSVCLSVLWIYTYICYKFSNSSPA